MPYIKQNKGEKLNADIVYEDTLGVLEEMLELIAERTECENNNSGILRRL